MSYELFIEEYTLSHFLIISFSNSIFHNLAIESNLKNLPICFKKPLFYLFC
jgi:hypothetical protein